jgi:DmsE family decaheme c-type cytochrome
MVKSVRCADAIRRISIVVRDRSPAIAAPVLLLISLMVPAPAFTQAADPGDRVSAHGTATIGHDGAYADLRRFAREVGIDPAPAAPPGDDVYSAMLDFARMIGADPDKPVLAQATAPAAKPAAVTPPAKPAAKPKAAAKPPAKKENKGGDGDPYFVGSSKCAECHGAITADFQQTQMGRIGRTTRKGTMECENCHGPGSKHVAAGGGQNQGMIAYRPTDPRYNIEEINETCLTCHERGGRTAWKGSTHETRGLACTNCHTVMKNVSPKNLLSAGAEAEVCFQCHKEARAQIWRSSHMPVREGKITCSDCHNAHGSVKGTEAMIREASINDNCYKCHAEKRGPVLWPHVPVVENCLNCHDAHGSNHENMLKVARPRLCAECHTFAHGTNGFGPSNTIFVMGRGCGNCHSKVHGSNHPSGGYFLR